MNPPAKTILAFSLAALVGLACFFISGSKPDDIQANQGAPKSPASTFAEKMPIEAAISPASQSDSTSNPVSELLKFDTEMAKRLSSELASTKNIKAFYDSHKNNKSAEGLHYAWIAVDACLPYRGYPDVTKSINNNPEDGSNYKARIAAAKEMIVRCVGFEDYGLKINAKEVIGARNKAKENPGAYQIANKISEAHHKNQLDEAGRLSKIVLDSKDPDAIWELAHNLTTYWLDEDKSNGRYHGLFEPLPAALMAVACEMGHYSCAKDSFVRFKMCAESDICRTSEEEMSMENVTTEQKNLFEQAKQDILQAINSGDYRQLGLPNK
jgi:hypothetical protein